MGISLDDLLDDKEPLPEPKNKKRFSPGWNPLGCLALAQTFVIMVLAYLLFASLQDSGDRQTVINIGVSPLPTNAIIVYGMIATPTPINSENTPPILATEPAPISVDNVHQIDQLVRFERVGEFAWSAGGQTLVTSNGRHIRWYNLYQQAPVIYEMWPDLTQDVPFALSPDQQNIAISSRTGQLTVSTIRGEEQILQLPSYGGRIRSVAYSHDGEYLAMTSEQGGIRVWNNVTSNVQWERAVTNDGEHVLLKGLDFSPDDQWLVTAGNDGKVIVREAATGEEIFSIEKDEVPTGFQFSADSQHIAMGVGNDVVLWDIESQEVVYQLVGHTESVNEVSFSPDQRMLASSGEDGNIILWDLETGEQLRMLSDDALPPEIIHMSMSPDGRLIGAIYSGDGIFPLVLWGVTDEG